MAAGHLLSLKLLILVKYSKLACILTKTLDREFYAITKELY